MIEINELVSNGLLLVLIAAWRALPLFVMVLLLVALFKKQIPAKYQCWLWMLVVARLLLPFSIDSPLAMAPKLEINADDIFAISSHNEPRHENNYFFYDANAWHAINSINAMPALASKADTQDVVLDSPSHARDRRSDAAESPHLFQIALSCMTWLWAAGVAFLLCRSTIAYCRFLLRLRGSALVEDREIVDRLLRTCDQLKVGRRPQIRQVQGLHVPAVFGILRPVLCLPNAWREQLSNNEIDLIFAHELAHVRRRDAMVLAVSGLARALHWCNPVSWIAHAKLQNSIERAADEAVTRQLAPSKVKAYGELLLRFASGASRATSAPVVGLLAMSSSKDLRARIEALTGMKSNRPWYVRTVASAAIALIACSGLTDAKSTESAPSQAEFPDLQSWLNDAEMPTMIPASEVDSQLSAAREISVNVHAAMRKASELQPGIDAERFVITYFTYPTTLGSPTITDSVLTTMATPTQEAFLKQRLEAFEQSGPWQVVADVRMIETNIRNLNQLDWFAGDEDTKCQRIAASGRADEKIWETLSSTNAAGGQVAATEVSDETQPTGPLLAIKVSQVESERLIRGCLSDTLTNVLQMPKVTMFNGQCGIIKDVIQRPFVTDVSMVQGDSARAMQPKISVFEDGWKYFIKSTVAPEGDKVDLQCVFTQSKIGDVKLAEVPAMLPNRPDMGCTIQVPSIQSDSMVIQSRLLADEVLLVFSPMPYDEAKPPQQKMARVLAIRTQPISDMEFMRDFAATVREE